MTLALYYTILNAGIVSRIDRARKILVRRDVSITSFVDPPKYTILRQSLYCFQIREMQVYRNSAGQLLSSIRRALTFYPAGPRAPLQFGWAATQRLLTQPALPASRRPNAQRR
jgi:hypothetical protein